jgi:hypothetical protein
MTGRVHQAPAWPEPQVGLRRDRCRRRALTATGGRRVEPRRAARPQPAARDSWPAGGLPGCLLCASRGRGRPCRQGAVPPSLRHEPLEARCCARRAKANFENDGLPRGLFRWCANAQAKRIGSDPIGPARLLGGCWSLALSFGTSGFPPIWHYSYPGGWPARVLRSRPLPKSVTISTRVVAGEVELISTSAADEPSLPARNR